MASDDSCSFTSGITKEVQNHNRGSGSFYQVNGTQNVYNCTHSVPSVSSGEKGAFSEGPNSGEHRKHGRELEPYQTIIDSISRIHQHVSSFAKHIQSHSSISDICNEVDDLKPLVLCVARTIRQIQQVSPVFVSHSIFSSIQFRAFKCAIWLKQLAKCLGEFKPRQHPSRARRKLGNISCSWPSLSQRLRKCFRVCRIAMRRFLRDLAYSHLMEIFGIKDGELAALITYLPHTWDVHHPSVDTIWVREPTGVEWYSIPLRFCRTWKDFSMVIYQYCRNGPEIEYIRRGQWAIIHSADNDVIDKETFTSIIKPEMRFDIGIIVQLLSVMLRSQCPQCGHYNGKSTQMNGWIQCSNLDCDNLFRIIFSPPPKVPKTSQEPVPRSASKNVDRPPETSEITQVTLSFDKENHTMGAPSGRPSRSLVRNPSSSRQKDLAGLNSVLGREHPGLPYLNTKFHRVLANISHSPLGEQDDVPKSLHRADTQKPNRDIQLPFDMNSNKTGAREPYLNTPIHILHKASKHADVVYALTKSNRKTFECLKVLCEKYNEKRTFILSHSKRKVYKHVVEQAAVYVDAIGISIRVAEKGMSISKVTKEFLDDKTVMPKVLVKPMLELTGEALRDIKGIFNRFQSIHIALFEEIRRIQSPREPPSDTSFPPSTDLVTGKRVDLNGKYFHLSCLVTLTKRVSELRRMDEKDLLKLTVLVLDQFVSTVGEFMDWWSGLNVDVDRLTGSIRFIRKNPDISTRVYKQWENTEQHYKIYQSEIMTQQDYYNHTLKELMPKSFLGRVISQLGLRE